MFIKIEYSNNRNEVIDLQNQRLFFEELLFQVDSILFY